VKLGPAHCEVVEVVVVTCIASASLVRTASGAALSASVDPNPASSSASGASRKFGLSDGSAPCGIITYAPCGIVPCGITPGDAAAAAADSAAVGGAPLPSAPVRGRGSRVVVEAAASEPGHAYEPRGAYRSIAP